MDTPSPADAPSELWHYTDAAGLLGILTHDRLWATQLSMLNDSGEMLFSKQLVSQYLDGRSSDIDQERANLVREQLCNAKATLGQASWSYSLSACTSGDSLPMWRNYGGSASYAIKLDPGTRLVPIIREDGDERLPKELPVFIHLDSDDRSLHPVYTGVAVSRGWEPVSYGRPSQALTAFIDSSLQAAESKEALSQHLGENMFEEIELSALHKHSTFKEESEHRYIFRASPDNVFRHFRATKHGVVGYIEVGTVHGAQPARPGGFTDSPGKLPILEVRQGPFGHFDGSIHTLKGLLESCGYTSMKVSKSESTYRE